MSTAERAAQADVAAAECAVAACVAAGSDGDGSCPESLTAGSTDLTWLLHRAAQHMRAGLDEAAKAHGLADARDWVVLSALSAGSRQTQLSLAHSLGLDKTTMTSLLDRLETRGLIIRRLDRHDRRARIPEITAAGSRVQGEVTRARDRHEAGLLRAFTEAERRQLRDLLTRLAAGPAGHGSCM